MENSADLVGWEILYVEDFKPNVKRLHVRNVRQPAQFRMLYSHKQHLIGLAGKYSKDFLEKMLSAEFFQEIHAAPSSDAGGRT